MEFLHCFFFLFYFFGGLLVGECFLLLPLFLLLHLPFVFPRFFFHLFLLIIFFSFPLPFLSFFLGASRGREDRGDKASVHYERILGICPQFSGGAGHVDTKTIVIRHCSMNELTKRQ